MKKCWLVCLLVLMLMFCSACQKEQMEATTGAPTKVPGTTADNGMVTMPPSRPKEEIPEDTSYQVSLRYNMEGITKNSQLYAAFSEKTIYAQWEQGDVSGQIPFDENGIADLGDLTGEFTVSLSDVPEGYACLQEDYSVLGDNRVYYIDLYRLIDAEESCYGDGSSLIWPQVKEFDEPCVYEIQIDGPDDVVYCRFTSSNFGKYIITSLASVKEDMIDPDVDIYRASLTEAEYDRTVVDGGRINPDGFTSNFSFEVELTQDESGVGLVGFGVKAKAKDGIYPIKVQIYIEKDTIIEDPHRLMYEVQYGRTVMAENGYLQIAEPIVTVIRSVEELEAYCLQNSQYFDFEKQYDPGYGLTMFADVVARYDSAYFEENVLVLILPPASNSSFLYDVFGVRWIPNSNVYIQIQRIIPDSYSEDLVFTHVFVELEQRYVNDQGVDVWLEDFEEECT